RRRFNRSSIGDRSMQRAPPRPPHYGSSGPRRYCPRGDRKTQCTRISSSPACGGALGGGPCRSTSAVWLRRRPRGLLRPPPFRDSEKSPVARRGTAEAPQEAVDRQQNPVSGREMLQPNHGAPGHGAEIEFFVEFQRPSAPDQEPAKSERQCDR